jgi:hypothetical protein
MALMGQFVFVFHRHKPRAKRGRHMRHHQKLRHGFMRGPFGANGEAARATTDFFMHSASIA